MWIRGGCDDRVELRVESKGGSSQGNGAKIQADVLPEPPQRAPEKRTIPSSVENFCADLLLVAIICRHGGISVIGKHRQDVPRCGMRRLRRVPTSAVVALSPCHRQCLWLLLLSNTRGESLGYENASAHH